MPVNPFFAGLTGPVHLRSLTEELCERKLEFGETDFLKSAPVYYLMQFFYSFRACRIETEEDVAKYAELHDNHVIKARDEYEALAKDADDAWKAKMALKKQSANSIDKETKGDRTVPTKVRKDKKHKVVPSHTRFEAAFLNNPYRIKQIAKNLRDGRDRGVLCFALSDLQRLMIAEMVKQHCGQTCWELSKLKLLEYSRVSSAVIIDSPGHLEGCFRDHLAFLVEAIRPLFQQAK